MTVGTVFTLFVVPVFYSIIGRRKTSSVEAVEGADRPLTAEAEVIHA
jgi:hypothetical protein